MEKKIEDIEDKIEVRMRDCGPEHFEEETDRYEDVWEGEVKQVVNYRWYKKGYEEPEVLYLNEVVEKLEMELVGLGLSEKALKVEIEDCIYLIHMHCAIRLKNGSVYRIGV